MLSHPLMWGSLGLDRQPTMVQNEPWGGYLRHNDDKYLHHDRMKNSEANRESPWESEGVAQKGSIVNSDASSPSPAHWDFEEPSFSSHIEDEDMHERSCRVQYQVHIPFVYAMTKSFAFLFPPLFHVFTLTGSCSGIPSDNDQSAQVGTAFYCTIFRYTQDLETPLTSVCETCITVHASPFQWYSWTGQRRLVVLLHLFYVYSIMLPPASPVLRQLTTLQQDDPGNAEISSDVHLKPLNRLWGITRLNRVRRTIPTTVVWIFLRFPQPALRLYASSISRFAYCLRLQGSVQ
jgi:hypothetical protein